MIKTKLRSIPSKGFAHSLGAKQISDLLIGIKLYEELTLTFDQKEGNKMGVFTPGWAGKYLKGHAKDLLLFRVVVSVSYSTPLDKWNLNLKAVKIESNKQVKVLLTEKLFPIVREWLEAEKTETWFTGHRYFQIGINEELSQFCILETQNDQIVQKRVFD